MNGSAPYSSLTGSQSVLIDEAPAEGLERGRRIDHQRDRQADQDAQAHQRQQERSKIEDAIAEQTDMKRADARLARPRRYVLVCPFQKFGQV